MLSETEGFIVNKLKQNTRRFAKRQITWFKREKGFQNVCLEKKDDPNSAIEKIAGLIIPPHNE